MKRLLACIGVKIFGLSQTKACTDACISRKGFNNHKWLKVFDRGAYNVLDEDGWDTRYMR